MKRFRYRIYKGNELILTNWVDSESKEEAIAKLQPLIKAHNGTDLKIIEVHSANNWKC